MVQIRVHGDVIGPIPISELPSDIVEVVTTSRPSIRRSRPDETSSPGSSPLISSLSAKPYDYLLKFLLVGDSDVGKQEILNTLENAASDIPFCAGPGIFIVHPVNFTQI